MRVTTTGKADIETMVDRLLRDNRPADVTPLLRNVAAAYTLLGVLEILFGIGALATPLLAGAAFALLLGSVITVSGIVNLATAVMKRSWARLGAGIAGVVAGLLLIAHPLFNLQFLTFLLGIYLLTAGTARLISYRESAWTAAGGILGVLLGFVTLLSIGSVTGLMLGLFIGVTLIAGGAGTVAVGMKISRRLRRAEVPVSRRG